MMRPYVAVCVHCSYKVKEMEKSVSVPDRPGAVAHLACSQKVAIRTPSPKEIPSDPMRGVASG
jgi:hypothetical protein